MIKNIVPIIALIGASAAIVCPTQNNKLKCAKAVESDVKSFENEVENYVNTNANLSSTALNKYEISAEIPEVINDNLDPDSENESIEENSDINEDLNIENEISNSDEETFDENIEIGDDNLNEISTLYSLSCDIENSCEDFCELKNDITKAIVETQNLINKVKEKQIELSDEERLYITEQAQQLKSLGRQLSNITTELSLNMSDLNQIALNGNNFDSLSLKYLIVLDNLVNGNEMLQSGLSSLNLINQMINSNSSNIPSNNTGRILYGYRQNNDPPVIKDYYLDENGNMIENNNSNSNQTNENTEQVSNEKNLNIDTYKNRNLSSNLDTYNTNNLPHNIDSFFNTALLDNEFMYGNGNYGYAGMNGINNYNYYPNNKINNYPLNSVDNSQSTQYNNTNTHEDKSQKEKKRFKLEKNIDTFKDENTPDIKTKLGNIKNSISNFFNKFKISNFEDKIENPVYRFTPEDNN